MSSLWANTPYELQSPAWRSAMAGGGNAGSKTTSFNPVWSENGINMLEAWQSVQSRATPQNSTTDADGQSGFLNALSGLSSALLQGMGGQPETQPEYMPVAYQQTGGAGLDLRMIALIGVGAGLIYYAVK